MSDHCQRCQIPEGLYLFQDYYPVSADFMQALSPRERTQVTQVKLDADKHCQYCRLYQRHYDAEALRQERADWIQATRHTPVVLALSGGKDSLTALYLLKTLLKLDVRCLLYQNGFIPTQVIAQAQRICDDLDTPLRVVSRSLRQAFNQEYPLKNGERVAQTGLDFCQLCARQLGHFLGPYLKEQNSQWVFMGNKNYARLSPSVSALKQHHHQGFRYYSINLLYALEISVTQQQEILKLMQWQDPQLSGYTSNCRVPGLVESARFKKLGVASDRGYVEAELRSGAYTREDVQHLLD